MSCCESTHGLVIRVSGHLGNGFGAKGQPVVTMQFPPNGVTLPLGTGESALVYQLDGGIELGGGARTRWAVEAGTGACWTDATQDTNVKASNPVPSLGVE
jgi:hypothetical protein